MLIAIMSAPGHPNVMAKLQVDSWEHAVAEAKVRGFILDDVVRYDKEYDCDGPYGDDDI